MDHTPEKDTAPNKRYEIYTNRNKCLYYNYFCCTVHYRNGLPKWLYLNFSLTKTPYLTYLWKVKRGRGCRITQESSWCFSFILEEVLLKLNLFILTNYLVLLDCKYVLRWVKYKKPKSSFSCAETTLLWQRRFDVENRKKWTTSSLVDTKLSNVLHVERG